MSWDDGDRGGGTSRGYAYADEDPSLDENSEQRGIKRPAWLTNKLLVIIIIILFLLGLGFLIAGSIMLGIGVSKSHTTCPTITASPYYATIESMKITYNDVMNNYSYAASVVADQVRSALTSSSSKASVLEAVANSDPYITVLGLSQSPKGDVMAVVGMAYTSADAPPLSTVESDLNRGPQMTLYHASNNAAPSPDQQMCSIVSIYQVAPSTPSITTPAGPPNSQSTITTITQTTASTTQPCVCPTTVCPTSGFTEKTTSPATVATTTRWSLATSFGTTSSSSRTSTGTTKTTPTTPTVNGSSSTQKSTTASTKTPGTTSFVTTGSTTKGTMGTTGSTTTESTVTTGSTSKEITGSTITPGTTSSKTTKATTISSVPTTTGSTVTAGPTTKGGATKTGTTATATTGTTVSTGPTTAAPTSTGSSSPSTTSSPTTITSATTTACIPVTPSPRPGARDVVVLIDDSSAVGSAANYNQMTTWLGKQLFPQWPVSQEKWEAAPTQFALKEYNLLMDFDANNVKELVISVTMSIFSGRNGPSITKGLKSTLGLMGRPGVHRVILLLSGSSNLTDLETALPLAEQAKNQGNDIITMALGDGADEGTLGLLASGPDYIFSSRTFSPSADQATAITDLIQGGSRTTAAGTTATVPTTTVNLVDFPCHPDIAVLVDTSEAVPSQDEYQRQLKFIADSLSPTWSISPLVVETEIVLFSTFYGGFLGHNDFNYNNYEEFADIVMGFEYFYNRVTPSSINGTLNYYVSTIGNRRPGRTPTTLLFAYSSNQDDIVAARSTLSSIGNLIVVGMGTSTEDKLTLLTGNVITGLNYGDQLIQQINALLCSPSTPAAVPTTQLQTTTPKASTLPSSTSGGPTTMGTTITPQNCPDCIPDEANILIAMDSSSLMTGKSLDLLKSFVNIQLTVNWTHAERLAILGFDDKTHFSAPIDFGDLNSMFEFHQLITASPQFTQPPSLTSAFQRSLNNFHPLSKFGQQKTVIFTISANPQDIATAGPYAQSLSQRGIVILVGMNMSDVSALQTLVPTVIAWPNLNDPKGVADQIMQGLAGAYLNYTTLTTTPTTSGTGSTPSTTVSSSTSSPTTQTTTVFSASPAICSRDVILLLDESNAFPDVDSFNKVKNWLIKTLIPLWEVNPTHVAVAPYGFANKTFDDLGGNFLVNSQAELETLIDHNLRYLPNTGASVHYGLSKAVAVQARPGAAVVLVSASDAANDVNQGMGYAGQLKQNGGTVITLMVGPNGTGHLINLSSGVSFYFFSRNFSISNEIAMDISDVLCSSAPPLTTTPVPPGSTTTTPTTTAPTTTTTVPPPFNCNPDVGLLFDSSMINSNDTTLAAIVNFVADSVVKGWVVNLDNTEAAPIFATTGHQLNGQGYWDYESRDDLQAQLHTMATYGVFTGDPSVKSLLSALQSTTQHRRKTAPLTAVMFTFSTDYQDVVSSMSVAQQLGANIVAVGLGPSDMKTLGLLTGNVIVPSSLNDDLAAFINNAICNPKPPTSVVTTTPTLPPTTTAASTTTATVATTTITPEGCPDCYPDMANLLILVDSSVDQTSVMFSNQKVAVLNLIAPWTHMERVALGSFSSSLSQLINYDDLASTDLRSLQIIVTNIQQTQNEADLGKSLHQATSIVPNPLYGEQRTILFTSMAVVSDKASQAGGNLRGKGQLIVVGIGMSDVTALSPLASPGDAIPWGNVSDTTTVVQDIMGALGATTRRPTESTTSGAQTTTLTTATTTLPPNVISCQKDVLLLVDTSNSYGGQQNFTATKNWIVSSLVPTWNIGPSRIAPLAGGFANKSWNNIGGDFGDVTSVSEFQTILNGQLYYLPSRGPSLAYGLRNAVAVSKPQTVVILISASEDPSDIGNSIQYAMKLKEYGGAVITLSMGPNAKGFLGQLSSGVNYSFVSKDYQISPNMANMISSRICGDEPLFTTTQLMTTTTPTATTPTTTPAAPPPFNCNPDVGLLFDSSAFNSNDSTLEAVVNFVADSVVKNWIVNLDNTEAAPVYATTAHTFYGMNYWDYQSRDDLQSRLHDMATYGVFPGDPSVKSLLSALQSTTQHRRKTAPLTAVMFTFSTDYQDVVSSMSVAQQLDANIVAVGLGSSDMKTLGLLTGNVIVPSSLNDDLAAFINNAICNPKPPTSVVTTTPTLPPTTTAASTTTATVATTTIAPEGCPDCYPAMANLLLLIDNSMNQTADTFSNEKQLVLNLISTWNHFERFSLATFADSLSPLVGYNDNLDYATLQKLINSLQQSNKVANLGRALYMATGISPVAVYGEQRTVLFTTTADNSDKAITAAGYLQQEGQLIAVGVAMTDASSLNGLASPGDAIAWGNVSDTTTVVQDIMGALGATTRPPTQSTVSGSSSKTTLGITTATTTLPPNVISCQKDVLLLVDTSNSYGGQQNFTATKNWIVKSLVPTWNVNPSEIASIAFGFANKSWNNIGGDFGDVTSVNEFQTILNGQLFYSADRSHALAYGLRNAVAVSKPQTVVILISASEDPSDIGNSIQYAMKLKEYGGAVITLAVGPNAKGFLGQLSSGQNFSYVSKDYAVSLAIATAISAQICRSEPLFTTSAQQTTTPVPTTVVSTVSPPFNCNPDVGLLFDSSMINSNDTTLAAIVNFVADSVVKGWIVNLDNTEAAPIFATTGHQLNGQGYWDYESRGDLQAQLHTMATYGVFTGDPSVKSLLSALQSTTQHRRKTAPLTAVMFTFSTDYQDVVSSMSVAQQLGANIVAVGLGSSDMKTLGLLTGNVIVPSSLNDDLAAFINNAICNPKPPISTITTTASTTATSTVGSTGSTTSSTLPPTTTVSLEICSDCFPPLANILLMIDISANQSADTFSDQKQAALNLIATWNHAERISLASFADSLSPMLSYNDTGDIAVFQKMISNLQQSQKAADLGKALYMATGIQPLGLYGQQQAMVFTTTADNSEKATSAAGKLQQEGQLIMVGVAMADVSSLTGLASPGGAIAWGNVNDTQGVVDDIMGAMGATSKPTPGPTSSTMVTTVTTRMTTTGGGTGGPITTISSMSSGSTASSLGTTATPTVRITTTPHPATATPGITASSTPSVSTVSSTAVSTTTAGPVCASNLILLLDDSNAIVSAGSFNQLKTWITSTFLPNLQSFLQVDAISYDNKLYNEMTGGFLPTSLVGVILNGAYNYQSSAGPNITRTLQRASTIQRPDGVTATLLISASSGVDDVANAGQYATEMKANGAFITLLIGGTYDGLLPLASDPSMSFSSESYTPNITVLNFILNAICPGTSTVSLATSGATISSKSTVTIPTATTTVVTGTTTGSSPTSSSSLLTTETTLPTGGSSTVPSTPASTTTAGPVCASDLILLLDDSNAIPTSANFQQLKTWIIGTFLPNLQTFIQVDPISFDDKKYLDLSGGFLPGSVVGFPLNDNYLYQGSSGPNISKALQKASTIQGPNGITSTLLISASSNTDDVANSVQYATAMKANGAFITLLIGGTGGGLLPLASGPSMSFSTAGFSPDVTILNDLLNAICPGTSTVSVPSTKTGSSTTTTFGSSTKSHSTAVTAPLTSTSTRSAVTTTAPSSTTVLITTAAVPTTTVDLYIPTKEDIVIVFDISNDVNTTTVNAQKQLVLALTANWTHFDRVGVVAASNGQQALAHYTDLHSQDDLKSLMQALAPDQTFLDLDKTLKFVRNNYPLEAQMSLRDVILFTASADPDDLAAAQNSADLIKTLGKLIVVGVGMDDISNLTTLASEYSAISFTNFQDFTQTAAQINQLLI